MDVSDFAQQVYLHAPDVPEPMVDATILYTTRDFCRRTRAWQLDLDPITIEAAEAVYDLFAQFEGEGGAADDPVAIVDVISVETVTQECVLSKGLPSTAGPGWRTDTGAPSAWWREAGTEIRLYPEPVVADTFIARVALMPTLLATTLDDDLVTDWGDSLLHGTLYRLYVMPEKPWSSQALASHYLALYTAAVDEAAAKQHDRRTQGIVRAVAYGGL